MLLLSGWLEDFVIKRKEICMDNNKFLTDDYHLNLDRVYEEIEFLYCEYGKEDDENLSKDAIQLKKDILTFIYKVKML